MTGRPLRRAALLTVGAIGLLGVGTASAAEIADYELQQTHASSVATSTVLTDLGTGNRFLTQKVDGLARDVVTVPEGGGLRIGNVSLPAYSVVIKLRLDQTDGYRRILDVNNGGNDRGIYDRNGHAVIYQGGPRSSAGVVFRPRAFTELAIVSSSDPGSAGGGLTALYANGAPVVQAPIPMAPEGSLRFLKDNTTGAGTGEDSGGRIACIRVFDQALDAGEVAAIHAQRGCTYAGGSAFRPVTSLRGKPPKRGTDRTPTFRFESSEPNSTFRCRIDHKRFRRCRSPFTLKRLHPGVHTFRVKAVDATGNADRTPAKYRFRILG